MIFGLEHQQATPPMNCVPDLWDSVVTFLFIFFRRSSRPGSLLWENDLRDDCFAPISPLESWDDYRGIPVNQDTIPTLCLDGQSR